MKLSPAFKKRCEAIAVNWRYEFQRQPYDALPAELVLEKLEGKAVTPDGHHIISPKLREYLMQQDDWSAMLVRLKPLLIVYHPAHTPARRQSSLMHEIAHVLLEHPPVRFHPETGMPMRNPVYEDEATYLGSCLQIPRLGLLWATQKGISIRAIAEHFGASEQLVNFRSNMTGIAIKS
jgi:hypothetical protein